MYAYIKHKQLHCNDNKFQKLILLPLTTCWYFSTKKTAKTNYHEYSTWLKFYQLNDIASEEILFENKKNYELYLWGNHFTPPSYFKPPWLYYFILYTFCFIIQIFLKTGVRHFILQPTSPCKVGCFIRKYEI